MKLLVYTKIVVLEDSSNNTVYRVYYRVERGQRELVVSSSNSGVLLRLSGRVDPKTVYEKLKPVSEELARLAASVV